MPMTVAEFAAWLLELPDQEATVMVVKHSQSSSRYGQGGTVEEVEFNPEPGKDSEYSGTFDYTDWRTNQFVKPDAPHYGQRHLTLGLVGE